MIGRVAVIMELMQKGVIMGEKLTRTEAIAKLHRFVFDLEQVTDKYQALQVVREAGVAVGYTPAFRCLVMGQRPEDSVRWKE